jgi:hypothetical protein
MEVYDFSWYVRSYENRELMKGFVNLLKANSFIQDPKSIYAYGSFQKEYKNYKEAYDDFF